MAKKDRIGIMTKYVARENIPRNEIKRLAYIMASVFDYLTEGTGHIRD